MLTSPLSSAKTKLLQDQPPPPPLQVQSPPSLQVHPPSPPPLHHFATLPRPIYSPQCQPVNLMTQGVGWADKEWSSTNHKYNKHRPSSRLNKGIAKYFLVFEMSLGSNSEVLILMKLKIRISHHY